MHFGSVGRIVLIPVCVFLRFIGYKVQDSQIENTYSGLSSRLLVSLGLACGLATLLRYPPYTYFISRENCLDTYKTTICRLFIQYSSSLRIIDVCYALAYFTDFYIKFNIELNPNKSIFAKYIFQNKLNMCSHLNENCSSVYCIDCAMKINKLFHNSMFKALRIAVVYRRTLLYSVYMLLLLRILSCGG